MKITDIDPNFKDSPIADNNIEYHCINDADKFSLTGVFYDTDKQAYGRVARQTLDAICEEGLEYLSYCSAGGEVRFTSNSPVIVIKAELIDKVDMPHMPRTGLSGFDVFRDGIFEKNVRPIAAEDTQIIGLGYFDDNNEKCSGNFSLFMPLYNGVKSLEIGIIEGCDISAYIEPRKKVIFYGSSITQGGCASKPSNAYSAMISRWYNIEQMNLGFSGNARGRTPMAEYVASLGCDLFVMDYDHNAPTLEHLAATHEPMFKIFRQANPDTPVIFVSRPRSRLDSCNELDSRKDTIMQTYDNARQTGDKNVYFIDGETLLAGLDRGACTMDGTHPNDLGFFRMAEVIGKKISEILELNIINS